jgi:hypothetical protein
VSTDCVPVCRRCAVVGLVVDDVGVDAQSHGCVAVSEASGDVVDRRAGLTTTGKDLTDSWAEWTERIHGRRRSGQEMAQRLTDAGVTKIPGRPVIWKGIGRLDFDQ